MPQELSEMQSCHRRPRHPRSRLHRYSASPRGFVAVVALPQTLESSTLLRNLRLRRSAIARRSDPRNPTAAPRTAAAGIDVTVRLRSTRTVSIVTALACAAAFQRRVASPQTAVFGDSASAAGRAACPAAGAGAAVDFDGHAVGAGLFVVADGLVGGCRAAFDWEVGGRDFGAVFDSCAG